MRIVFPINLSNCSSICAGIGPPVTNIPSSMLMLKAYSVRFALDRNRQRPSATALDVQDADFATLGHRPHLFRPVVDRRTRPHVGPEGLNRVVNALSLDAIGRFHDDLDLHAATGGSYKSIGNTRNLVNRVADQRDPLLGRIQDLKDRLFGTAKWPCVGHWPRPNQFDGLLLPMGLF